MSDNYLEENGIDKQKILEKQERNKRLTIGESAMFPYVIMGIKALNSNLGALSSSFKDDLEKISFATEQAFGEIDQKIKNLSNEILAIDDVQK